MGVPSPRAAGRRGLGLAETEGRWRSSVRAGLTVRALTDGRSSNINREGCPKMEIQVEYKQEGRGQLVVTARDEAGESVSSAYVWRHKRGEWTHSHRFVNDPKFPSVGEAARDCADVLRAEVSEQVEAASEVAGFLAGGRFD